MIDSNTINSINFTWNHRRISSQRIGLIEQVYTPTTPLDVLNLSWSALSPSYCWIKRVKYNLKYNKCEVTLQPLLSIKRQNSWAINTLLILQNKRFITFIIYCIYIFRAFLSIILLYFHTFLNIWESSHPLNKIFCKH
jgi:hypothetical protein